MRCPNCSTELPDSAKFCLECGRDLRGRSEFASPAAYTPKHLAERILTSRAALEGERKQVTVLFCDIANSTPLAERVGPERMHALLNGFFELALAAVHKLEGTINQFLGDGFMALFGAPLAHEDDARRAVLAAVKIRRELKDRASYAGLGAGAELTVRMGLNTGLVVVGSIGDNLRMDYTAVGDTTNVAARLQHAAEPGEILVSEATARLVRREVRLLSAGALSVKGKTDPVTAYKVLGVAPQQSAFEHAAERAYGRFVGREAEMRRLAELLTAAQAGAGGLVSIVGEAGSGKSRLLYEFRRTLGATDVTTLEARCRSYGAAIPYLPLLDLVRGQCGIDERDPPETATSRVRVTLSDLGLDVDERAPLILNLLGIKEGTAAVEDIPQDVVRARTVETLSQMLVEAGRRRPQLIVVEDLHWIDAASEDYLSSLVSELEEAAVLLVATHRPDWTPPWAAEGPECFTQLVLPRLNDDESFTLVAEVVTRTQLPDNLVQAIVARADGNPFFLEELARSVADDGAPEPALSVPDSLRAVLSARIDRLPDGPKRLLQTAAVLGREFPRDLLDAVWNGPGSAAAHVAELIRLDFVHEQSGGDDAVYAFNHALTQEVAYESLLSGPREALHEAAARAIEAQPARMERGWARLAYHWTRTAHADKAVEALRRVAGRAMATYANAEAVAALREAEAHAARLGDAAERVTLELVLERAQAQFLLGQLPELIADLEALTPSVERLADPSLTGLYHFRLAAARGMLGDTVGAIEHGERALAEAERAGDTGTAGKAHYTLTRECFWSGDFVRGVEHGRQAIARLERSGDRWWLGMTNWMRALNYLQLGRFDEALESAAAVAAIGDRLGDARLASYAAWVRGWVQTTRGEFAAGIAAGHRAVDLAPDEMALALAESFLGIGYVENGDAEAGLPYLERAAAGFARLHFPQLEGLLVIFQAQGHLSRGDHSRAAALITSGLEIVRGRRFAPAIVLARILESALAQARGDLVGAEKLLREGLALAEERQARYSAGRVHLALADVAQARADRAAVASHLADAHARFVATSAPVWARRVEDAARAAGVTLPAPA
ncbi:MAG TPA: adenylate/guanylate cyclase domain-containing protein [Methylomirabilota bacterium]|jgi:class 3 adenylate cyclase/tetratricopeptide (TPR) repeat protein